jgi:hypothetical protein
MLNFGKPNSSRQWYNSRLSSLIFIFSLNIWQVNQLERSKSLLSEQINTTYGQTLTTGSLTTLPRILALPLSSNCRSLNQTSLKGPGSVTLRWQFGLLQLYVADDRQEAVYTLCLPLWDDCVHCFLSVTPMRFYPEIKTHMSTQNTYLKNRLKGATQFGLHNTHLKYTFAQTKLIHFIYNNSHYALCSQRILKHNGSFPWHCTKLSLQPQTIFTKENIPNLLTAFFLMYIYSSWLNNFYIFSGWLICHILISLTPMC